MSEYESIYQNQNTHTINMSEKRSSRRDGRGGSGRKKRDRKRRSYPSDSGRKRRSYPSDDEDREVRTESLSLSLSSTHTHTYTTLHRNDCTQMNRQGVIPKSIPVVEEVFEYNSRMRRRTGIYLMRIVDQNHHHEKSSERRRRGHILNPHHSKGESLLRYFRIFVER